MNALATFLSGTALVLAPASQGDHGYIVHEGGTVNFHVVQQPDSDGHLRAAIEFANLDTWKTYWREPGASGIPPQLTVTMGGIELVSTIKFPAPVWLSDDYATYAGYQGPITLPVVIDVGKEASDIESLSVSLFAGVCEEICVPVSGTFKVGKEGSNFTTTLQSTITVETAFQHLPRLVDAKDYVSGAWHKDSSTIHVELNAALKEDAVFVSMASNHSGLRQPRRDPNNPNVVIIESVRKDVALTDADMTIVSVGSESAVEFVLPAAQISKSQ